MEAYLFETYYLDSGDLTVVLARVERLWGTRVTDDNEIYVTS